MAARLQQLTASASLPVFTQEAMEVARAFFHTPRPQPQHHLAELRIEADQSPVSFSDPCAAGRKRRCLFPAISPRKKMLVELPPFSSAPAPSPPASTRRTASVFLSTPTDGSGGGSNGSFAFCALPEQPLAPAGSLALLASPERPLTPMGSTANSAFGILASQPSLPHGPRVSNGTNAFAFLASPKPARTGSNGNDGGGSAFSASPNPTFGRTGSSAPAAAKELASAVPGVSFGGGAVVSPVRKSEGSTLWSRRRRSRQQWEEQLQITLPAQKVAKTAALASTGVSPRRATLSASTARPCCTFLNSPAKASKQEAKKTILAASDASRSSSPHRSPAATCCKFVTSPTGPSSSVEKASKREREVRAAGEGATSPAACAGAEVTVRVTCSCGAHKEFWFDHCH